jgi:hypothetical protein
MVELGVETRVEPGMEDACEAMKILDEGEGGSELNSGNGTVWRTPEKDSWTKVGVESGAMIRETADSPK